MSTDPGPTQRANGTTDTPVDGRTDLVEDNPPSSHLESEQASEGEFDAMPETPAPAPRDPPTPAPVSPKADVAEEGGSTEETGAVANLVYEDMLARLALATKAPGPEPEMLTLKDPSSLPESVAESIPPRSTPSMFPSAPSLLATPAARRITPVNLNPLGAEDEDPTLPGRRTASQAQPNIVQEVRPAFAESLVTVQGGARSRLLYLMLGGMLVLGGMLLAVMVLKLLMPTPALQIPAAVVPAPLPPPPSYAPPIHVEPLPAGTPGIVVPTAPTEPAPAAARENPAAVREGAAGVEPAQVQPSPRKAGTHSKPTRPAIPPAAAAPKPARATEPAAAPEAPQAAAPPEKAATPPAGRKSGRSGAYVDPFE